MNISNLQGVLLLSSFERDVKDSSDMPNFFSGAVVYVYADDKDGVKGVILNKPFLPDAKVLVSGLDISLNDKQTEKFNSDLFIGGSSSLSRVSVIYEDLIGGEIKFSRSKKIVRSCMLDENDLHHLFLLGESSWRSKELYPEIAKGWWHIVPASSKIVFSGPYDLMYDRALQSLGSSAAGVIMAPFHGRA